MVLATRQKKDAFAARRLLIEAAWSCRFPARIRQDLLLRQEKLSKPVRDMAWKVQERAFVCLAIAQTKPESSRAIAAVITVFSFPYTRACDTDGIVRYEARIDSRLEASRAETTRRISAGKRSSSRTTATVLVWDAGRPRIGRRGPEPCQATIREAPSIV